MIWLTSLIFVLLLTLTNYTEDAPFLGLIFLVQPVLLYLFLRVRFAIDQPIIVCCSCTEQKHLRFIFFVGLFSVFVIICDLFDLFSAAVSQSGLLNESAGLFFLELLSMMQAIAVLIIFWRYPTWFLSERAAGRELDMLAR